MGHRLQGKVALIYGAGSSGHGWGNGKAVAALFAEEGAHVIVIDRDGRAAAETREVIRARGQDCEAMEADVTVAADVARVTAHVREVHGRIDILHNNVGITTMGDAVELAEEDWKRTLDVNLTGAFLTCKHTLPIMLEQGRGAIVNISSLASVQINRYPYVAYSASKAGLNHFTRAIAVQYAPHGIRANAILPGVMDTPLIYSEIASTFESVEDMVRARNAASPMGRMGDAWDVARAALFLASDEASYITGVCLPVDGGKSCAGR